MRELLETAANGNTHPIFAIACDNRFEDDQPLKATLSQVGLPTNCSGLQLPEPHLQLV